MALTLTDSASEIRTTLGTGTAAVLDVGTSENNILQLNGSGALPAIDGSNLTGVGATDPEYVYLYPSANTAMSNDTWTTTSNSLMSGTPLGNKVADWYNSSTGKFSVTETGLYYIDMSFSVWGSANYAVNITTNILLNSSSPGNGAVAEGSFYDNGVNSASDYTCNCNALLELTPSDVVHGEYYASYPSGYPISADGRGTSFLIMRVQ